MVQTKTILLGNPRLVHSDWMASFNYISPRETEKNIKRHEVLFHESSKRIIDMNLLLEHESSREMTLLIF